jgi:hypothetical protein
VSVDERSWHDIVERACDHNEILVYRRPWWQRFRKVTYWVCIRCDRYRLPREGDAVREYRDHPGLARRLEKRKHREWVKEHGAEPFDGEGGP